MFKKELFGLEFPKLLKLILQKMEQKKVNVTAIVIISLNF